MNILYLIIAVIVLIITIVKSKEYLYDVRRLIPRLLIGMVIALTILILPFSEGKDGISKLVFSVIYAAQTIILSENVSLVTQINITEFIDMIYVGIIYVLFLIMPLLTVSFLISLLNDFTTKIKLLLIAKNKTVIFSELNEKSITIAEKIKDKNATFIFANSKEEDNIFNKRANNLNATKMEGDIENIEIKYINSKDITFYILSEDEDDNLNKTLQLIEKYKNKNKNIKIYLITNNDMAGIILDSTDKGKIKVEIVNEIERTVCQILQDIPLFLNVVDKEISVLIVGAGRVGLEFLKAITWCGQIIGYKLKVTLMDRNANKIKEKIMVEYPELINNYNYDFINVDVDSSEINEELSKIKNVNYIIVTLSNEEESLREAIFLRRYFISCDKQNFQNRPIINVWIENDLKNEQVNKLRNEKGNQYDLNAFGSVRQMYYDNPIIDSYLEEMTKRVHLSYSPDDKNLNEFYKKDYNIRSSRAFALHIKYKLYSILQENYTGNEKIDAKNFAIYLNNEEVLDYLVRNEHDRWMAYMRTNGFKVAMPEDVEKYRGETKNHINFLAKMHPALVDYDNLDIVERQIGVKLKNKDEMIIEKIPEIVGFSVEFNNQEVEEQIENYVPSPIDTSDVILDKDIIELSEKLAKNVHEVWAKNRIKQGWKYGKERDENLKLHSCLVPYEELTEEEKKYDRDTLLESLKVLTKLGYRIEKK